jgi:hypothetical protein
MGFRNPIVIADEVTSGTFAGTYTIGGLMVVGNPNASHVAIGTDTHGADGVRLYATDGVTPLIDLNIAGTPTITGALIRTASSGQRVELTATAASLVNFYTGNAIETAPGAIGSQVIGGTLYTNVKGPTAGSMTSPPQLQLWNNGTTQAAGLNSPQGPASLQSNGYVATLDGAIADPTGVRFGLGLYVASGTPSTDLIVGGVSPILITGRGVIGTASTWAYNNGANRTGAVGQWFSGVGLQATSAWSNANPGKSVFAIRTIDPTTILEVDTFGNILIGANNTGSNSYPFGLTPGGVGSPSRGSKGGLMSASGTISGGPFPTFGTWYSGIGINLVAAQAANSGNNAFGLNDNNGKTLVNMTMTPTIEIAATASDSAAPLTAGAGTLYVLNGALRYRGGSGTFTTIAAA